MLIILQEAILFETVSIVEEVTLNKNDFINAINRSVEEFNEMREQHLGNLPDLSGIDLSGKVLDGVIFSGFNLQYAKFRRCKLREAEFKKAQLENASFSNAVCDSAVFDYSSLLSAKCDGASFRGAKFVNCKVENSNFIGADFSNATMIDSIWNLSNFTDADLHCANVQGSRFEQCKIGSTFAWGLSKTESAFFKDLEVTTMPSWRFEKYKVSSSSGGQTIEFRQYKRRLKNNAMRILYWSSIRTVGKLPLFKISSTAIISIPILLYLRAQWNRFVNGSVEMIKESDPLPETADNSWLVWHRNLVEKVSALGTDLQLAIPTDSLLLLVSIGLLAMASSLYMLFCPPRIKEFSLEQWCDQFGHDAIQYVPRAWTRPMIRWLTALLYASGGVLVLVYLSKKIWAATIVIWNAM